MSQNDSLAKMATATKTAEGEVSLDGYVNENERQERGTRMANHETELELSRQLFRRRIWFGLAIIAIILGIFQGPAVLNFFDPDFRSAYNRYDEISTKVEQLKAQRGQVDAAYKKRQELQGGAVSKAADLAAYEAQ